MLGPSFIAISGYHGQIDSAAILPAVIALMVWERSSSPNRALWAGLLIGVGAAVKLPPLLLVLPLLGSAKSWREAAKLVGAALAVLLLALGPLWVSGIDLSRVVRYAGFPGWGGLSLVVDPALGWHVLTRGLPLRPPPATSCRPSRKMRGGSPSCTRDLHGICVSIPPRRGGRRRPAVAGRLRLQSKLFSQLSGVRIAVFIMAGFLVEVAVLQALLIAPTVAYYIALWPAPSTATGVLYVPALIALWAVWVLATLAMAWRVVEQREQNFTRVQPPLVNLS